MTPRIKRVCFVVSFLGALAVAMPSFADRDGQKGGKGGGGDGGQGGRAAAKSSKSSQGPQGGPKANSPSPQSAPRGFSPQAGKGGDGKKNDNPQSALTGRRDLPKTDSQKGQAQGKDNVPRTFRQDGVTAPNPNRAPDPRVARGTDRDDLDRALRQQQSFYRGPNDRSDKDLRDQANLNRDRDRDRDRGDDEWRDRDRDRFDKDRDRDRDRFSRDLTRLRSDWYGRNRSNLPFRYGYWDAYPRDRWPTYGPWASARWRDRPNYWWGSTTASALTPWLAFGWSQPHYWQYGQGANIYYQDDYVYYDGRQYEPVATYYDRMYALAHSVPNIDAATAETMEWQPLGVFVATNDGQPGERSMQLAVNRDGVMTGTYQSVDKGDVHPLAGMVDKKSQRAAWAFADGAQPKVVFETSLFNLTNDQATMMVHFGPKSDETQVWRLVRMDQPDANGALPGNVQSSTALGNQLP